MNNLSIVGTTAATGLLLAFCGCSSLGNQQARFEESRTVTVPHVAGSAVQVFGVNGSISLRVEKRYDVLVKATPKAVSEERLDAARIIAERGPGGRLEISVAWPDNKRLGNEGCHFEVLLPDAMGVTLKSSNGGLEVSATSGTADLQTSNGSIKVLDHQGDVIARSSNGPLTVRNAAGAVSLRTSNGRIEVESAADAVDARTSNGPIKVSLVDPGFGPVELKTSNGSVTVEGADRLRGQLSARTSNGPIHLGENLDADIHSQEKHHVHLDFGGSGESSRIRTSNGSIRVR